MPDIWNHFLRRERDLTGGAVVEAIEVELAPDDRSGTLKAVANLRADTELDAYLKVFERAALDEHGRVEVVKYSYYLVIDGAEVRGWDQDPTHDPPVHGHIGADHRRTEAPEVSLQEALDFAWDEVQLAAESESN